MNESVHCIFVVEITDCVDYARHLPGLFYVWNQSYIFIMKKNSVPIDCTYRHDRRCIRVLGKYNLTLKVIVEIIHFSYRHQKGQSSIRVTRYRPA